MTADVQDLAGRVGERIGFGIPDLEDRVEVVGGYAGESYGAVTDAALEAIGLFGRLEGLILDPVYTGKGAAGLVGLIRDGRFSKDDTVVFAHTGGWPGLLAYRTEVTALL